MNNKALLLISLGTPDKASFFSVGRYLSQFLGDRRIVNIPAILRFILVNLIIVPFRSYSSSKAYKQVWTDRGSPFFLPDQRNISTLFFLLMLSLRGPAGKKSLFPKLFSESSRTIS